MPRTRNVTRKQWQAAVSPMGDPNASAIRILGSASTRRQPKASHLSLGEANTSPHSSLKENSGYDLEYDDENVDENVPPVVHNKRKGKERAHGEIPRGKKRKQQPLQDITDLVVSHGNRPSDTEDTPRGGRRVKRRRRVGTIALAHPTSPSPAINRVAVTRIPFPSSLPPSSPPPPASFELLTPSARQGHEIWEEAVPQELEELPWASEDPEPAQDSDPFGFFVVEKELKVQRNRNFRPNPNIELREAGGLVLVPASSPPPLQLDITAILDEPETEEFISPCATPKTPHKRKRRSTINTLGKGKEKEDLLFSPRTASLPSSPSPLKVRKPRREKENFHRSSFLAETTIARSDDDADGDNGSDIATENPPHRVLRSMAKAKQVKEPTILQEKMRVKRGRENKSNTPSDPVELARKLLDRLPKRRKKQEPEDEVHEEIKPCRTKRQRKSHAARKAIKTEKPTKAKVEVDNGRKAIRDYFKKLEEYTLEEEKVYVI